MALQQPPPFNVDFIDTSTKRVAEPWKRFFLAAATELAVNVAPSNGPYIITTANAFLASAHNLGLLTTGLLRITTVAGVATPSTVAIVPVSSGGTGDATLTAHAALLGEGTTAVGFAAPGTIGGLLASNGTTLDPSFQNPPWLVAPASTVLTIAANAIVPTRRIHHCGAGLIKTITVPATLTGPDTLTLIPDAAFTYDATGNIGAVIGGLAVVGRPLTMTWDGAAWWPSY